MAFNLSGGMGEVGVSSVPLGSLAGGGVAGRLGCRRPPGTPAVLFGIGAIGAADVPTRFG